MNDQNKIKFLKALVLALKLLVIFIIIYLLILPFYPEIRYRLFSNNGLDSKEITQVVVETNEIKAEPAKKAKTGKKEPEVFGNRLIIPKIGVNVPIIETENEKYGLSMGAWLVPKGSTPDKGGNTIITGHRFKYLPPSNLTFYLFHKLEVGDVFLVTWKGTDYFYRIKEVKVVDPSDLSPYDESQNPILTMYTCHPIYSTEKRLVIISELVNK